MEPSDITLGSVEANFLNTIIEQKQREVAAESALVSLETMKERARSAAPPRSFNGALRSTEFPAIIAEIKRASPSKGPIRPDLDPVATAVGYAKAGAACLSVLTDEKFFQGKLSFLADIRAKLPRIPLLRKDFIIDPYQVWQTRASGADALLLIVAALSDEALAALTIEATEANLSILMEVHTAEEVRRAELAIMEIEDSEQRILLGVNNRDLKTFEIDMSTTKRLIEEKQLLPALKTMMIVAESGIQTADDIHSMAAAGAHAFLVGESLVSKGDPGVNLENLIREAQRA